MPLALHACFSVAILKSNENQEYSDVDRLAGLTMADSLAIKRSCTSSTRRRLYKGKVLLVNAFLVLCCFLLRHGQAARRSSLYTKLGIHRKATTEEIRKAYRKAALKHHPDKGGDEKVRLLVRTMWLCLPRACIHI